MELLIAFSDPCDPNQDESAVWWTKPVITQLQGTTPADWQKATVSRKHLDKHEILSGQQHSF